MNSEERDTLRKLLVRYEGTLALAEDLALSLLDVLQPEGVSLSPEQARERRRSTGDALSVIGAGSTYAANLWKSLDLERRKLPSGGPLPTSISKERRRPHRRRSTT
jgi:hypothetical protein